MGGLGHNTRGDATFYASALTYITPPGKRQRNAMKHHEMHGGDEQINGEINEKNSTK